jgi:vacuolar iron transporter family protein
LIESAYEALFISVGITGAVLLVFGVVRGYLTGSRRTLSWLLISALETLSIGALAAGASYGIVRLVNRSDIDSNSVCNNMLLRK